MSNIVTDEMPIAPSQSQADNDVPFAQEAKFSSRISMGALSQGATFDETFPKGLYTMRAKSYTKGEWENPDLNGGDPYYNISWEIVSPAQFAGRRYNDKLNFARKYDIDNALTNPECAARNTKRLGLAKQLVQAMGITAPDFDFEADVLDKQPEVKVEVVEEVKNIKNDAGAWVKDPDGKKKNRIKGFLPLTKRR